MRALIAQGFAGCGMAFASVNMYDAAPALSFVVAAVSTWAAIDAATKLWFWKQ